MIEDFRLVVFDWEGTLADTLGQVVHVIRAEAEKLHLEEMDEAQLKSAIGLGLVNGIKKGFPQLASHQGQQLIQAVQQAMCMRTQDICLFPDAQHLIKKLQALGIHLAIASNKARSSLQRALQQTQLTSFFPVIRSASDTLPKPHPQMLEEILADYHLQAQDGIMIGDSLSDIEMALQIGMPIIGVDFYHQGTEQLMAAGARAVVSSYQELAKLLGLSLEEA